MEKKNKYKLVCVEWVDAYGCSSHWEQIGYIQPLTMKCFSVGWLVFEDKEMIIIVPHLSQSNHETIEQQGCGDMSIPRSAIKKMKIIKGY